MTAKNFRLVAPTMPGSPLNNDGIQYAAIRHGNRYELVRLGDSLVSNGLIPHFTVVRNKDNKVVDGGGKYDYYDFEEETVK